MHEQVIYFGAPGTGKSHKVGEIVQTIPEDRIFRVTIYPEFTYSDFIGQLLPEEDSAGRLKFKFKPGQFTKALKKAYSDSSKEVWLILEEISRGNITAIFGDVFQLLDRDDEFKSKFPIKNKDIADQIPQLSNEIVILPSNLNILCTVNINDQSVYPMDTAFKRRFDWKYVSTLPVKDDSGVYDLALNNPLMTIRYRKNASNMDFKMSWLAFYTSLNSFITSKTLGLGMKEDKQVGQFFIKFAKTIADNTYSANAATADSALKKIDSIIMDKLLVYLWQDIQPCASFGTRKSLFSGQVSDFNTLYYSYMNEQVFSDEFIEGFLKPNENSYR